MVRAVADFPLCEIDACCPRVEQLDELLIRVGSRRIVQKFRDNDLSRNDGGTERERKRNADKCATPQTRLPHEAPAVILPEKLNRPVHWVQNRAESGDVAGGQCRGAGYVRPAPCAKGRRGWVVPRRNVRTRILPVSVRVKCRPVSE